MYSSKIILLIDMLLPLIPITILDLVMINTVPVPWRQPRPRRRNGGDDNNNNDDDDDFEEEEEDRGW